MQFAILTVLAVVAVCAYAKPIGIESGGGFKPYGIESGGGFKPMGIESGGGFKPFGIESGGGFKPMGIESGGGFGGGFGGGVRVEGGGGEFKPLLNLISNV